VKRILLDDAADSTDALVEFLYIGVPKGENLRDTSGEPVREPLKSDEVFTRLRRF
jgi:hypothetical protein